MNEPLFKIIDLFQTANGKMTHIDFGQSLQEVAKELRGVVVETASAVCEMMPEILAEPGEQQSVMIRLALVKMNIFFLDTLQLLHEKKEKPANYPVDEEYANLYNFLYTLVSLSNAMLQKKPKKELIERISQSAGAKLYSA